MNPADFELLRGLLRERSGLALEDDKAYLLESRLTPVARQLGLDCLDSLIAELRAAPSETVVRRVTEAMTTNESFFFRDGRPFEYVREVLLPELTAARRPSGRLRIWSAGCSTGQEPYSIAMLLREAAPQLAARTVELLATDISDEVLEKARSGLYSQFEVQRGLPIRLLTRHFRQVQGMWQIDHRLRAMASFRQHNLLDDLTALDGFDLIFCRNVLMYFDRPTRARVVEALADRLPADGCLVLGAAETLLGLGAALAPVPGERGIYRRRG